MRTDVIIVGAGVIGLCAAYSLRKRGMDVIVVDRGEAGGGCSHGNGGWICPSFSDPMPAPGLLTSSLRWLLQPDSPLYIRPRPSLEFLHWLWSFQRACNERDYRRGLDALARLNQRTVDLFDAMAADGVAFEMHEQGLLFLFKSEAAAEQQAHDLSLMQRYGYPPARAMTRAELGAEGLDLTEGVTGGLLAPAERHVRPESVIRGLVQRLDEMGTPVHAGVRVSEFAYRNGRVAGVRMLQGTIEASFVLLAAGVWSGHLATLIGSRIPLQAGKGYSVTMAGAAMPVSRPIYLSEVHVGLSPYDGALRILGTMELSGMNTYQNPRRIAAIKRAPSAYLRGWDVTNVQEEWTGMRPLLPDGLPVIGPAPSSANVILATGHAMLGITLGPATGEAVADLITGQPDHALLAPFRADRF